MKIKMAANLEKRLTRRSMAQMKDGDRVVCIAIGSARSSLAKTFVELTQQSAFYTPRKQCTFLDA